MERIAIVDDNETWCFVLSLQLEQQGYTVSTFTSTQAFLNEVDQFDLVLIDFSIPNPHYLVDMDGPEVIGQVKKQLLNPPIMVLISSFFTQDVLNNATNICPEADAILSKQIEITELFDQIRQLISIRRWSKRNHPYSHHSNLFRNAERRTRL